MYILTYQYHPVFSDQQSIFD